MAFRRIDGTISTPRSSNPSGAIMYQAADTDTIYLQRTENWVSSYNNVIPAHFLPEEGSEEATADMSSYGTFEKNYFIFGSSCIADTDNIQWTCSGSLSMSRNYTDGYKGYSDTGTVNAKPDGTGFLRVFTRTGDGIYGPGTSSDASGPFVPSYLGEHNSNFGPGFTSSTTFSWQSPQSYAAWMAEKPGILFSALDSAATSCYVAGTGVVDAYTQINDPGAFNSKTAGGSINEPSFQMRRVQMRFFAAPSQFTGLPAKLRRCKITYDVLHISPSDVVTVVELDSTIERTDIPDAPTDKWPASSASNNVWFIGDWITLLPPEDAGTVKLCNVRFQYVSTPWSPADMLQIGLAPYETIEIP